MGYDMYCEGGSHPRTEQTKAIFDAAGGWQQDDKAAARKLYEAVMVAERNEGTYFRLNIWGMGEYRVNMLDLGMMVDGASPAPEDWNEVGTEPVPDRDSGLGLLPAYKFGSNDGWLVNKAEIEGALEVYDGLSSSEIDLVTGGPSDEGFAYWVAWIGFLRHTATHGGFRVW